MKKRILLFGLILALSLMFCSCSDGTESTDVNNDSSVTSTEIANITNIDEKPDNSGELIELFNDEPSENQEISDAPNNEILSVQDTEKEQDTDNTVATTNNTEHTEASHQNAKDDASTLNQGSDSPDPSSKDKTTESSGTKSDSKNTTLFSDVVIHESGGWPHFTGTAKGNESSYITIDQFLNFVDIIHVTPKNWKDYFEIFAYDHCYSYINNILNDYDGNYEVFLGPKEEYYFCTPYDITLGSKSSGKTFTNPALIVEKGNIYRIDTSLVRHPINFDDLYCVSTDVVLYRINVPEEYIFVDTSEGFNKYYVKVLNEEKAIMDIRCYEELYLLAKSLTE